MKKIDFNIGEELVSFVKYCNTFPLKSPIDYNQVLFYLEKIYQCIYYADNSEETIKFSTQTDQGETSEHILLDNSQNFFEKIFKETKHVNSNREVFALFDITNKFLNTINNVSQKLIVLIVEHHYLSFQINWFVANGNPGLTPDFVNFRLSIIENSITDDSSIEHVKIHLQYLSYKVDLFIYQNQIFQIYNELKSKYSTTKINVVKKNIIKQIVNLNHNFQLENKNYSIDIINDNSELFLKDELESLKIDILNRPDGTMVNSMSYQQGSIKIEEYLDNNIHTIISFSIPYHLQSNKEEKLILDDYTSVTFTPILNKFSDPLFKQYKGLNIFGLSFIAISDISNTADHTHVSITINKVYSPDHEFKNGIYTSTDFSEKKALTGRDYYPHKEFVVKSFLKKKTEITKLLNIKSCDIDINLFSNYTTAFYSLGKSKMIYQKLYIFTNPDSYKNATNGFLERLNELNLSDYYTPITEVINNAYLVSDRALSNFIQKLLDIILKNNIELQSNYKYFWTKNKNNKLVPQKEPDMQPFITSQLKGICDYMGIQFSRETESANGKIDFLCSYTYNGKLLKTCVELKNAHSPKIDLGVTMQLPEYLKSERTKSGIYLVLWYKGDIFEEPKKHKSIDELKLHLDNIKDLNFDITNIMIDCSKPISPSRLR